MTAMVAIKPNSHKETLHPFNHKCGARPPVLAVGTYTDGASRWRHARLFMNDARGIPHYLSPSGETRIVNSFSACLL